MKKKLIVFLITTLIVSSNVALANTNGVQAATTDSTTTVDNTDTVDDKIKVSLENIREIMTENNLDIKILNNKLKIARETYQDAKDTKDAATKPTQAEYKTTDEVTGIVTDNSKGYTDALTAYNKTVSDYEKAKEDRKTANQNYENGVESKILTAEQDYMNYLVTLSDKQLQEDTGKSTERNAKILKIKYDSGFISNKEYVNSTITNTQSNDTLKKAINDEALQKTKLCNELGVSEDDIVINTDINEDFIKISQINYNNDLETMLSNNKSVQTANDNVDNFDETNNDTDTNYDYEMDNVKIELKKSEIKAEEDFKAQYNNLMSSYNSTKSSYDKIIQKQKEYQNNQIRYDYGFLSKNDTDDAKVTFEKDSNDFIKMRNACYVEYLKYIQMKEGY